MAGQVKGVLFVDYVRMLRAHRDPSWMQHLEAEDIPFINQTIDPAGWYPMQTFERLGLAILHSVAQDHLDLVRQWGKASVEHVASTVDHVIVPGDPRESLMRFQVFRRAFFDFEALTFLHVSDRSVDVQISYGMSPLAEEAASIQTMGFFEGLLQLSSGAAVTSVFSERTWRGDARTVLRVGWQPPFGR